MTITSLIDRREFPSPVEVVAFLAFSFVGLGVLTLVRAVWRKGTAVPAKR